MKPDSEDPTNSRIQNTIIDRRPVVQILRNHMRKPAAILIALTMVGLPYITPTPEAVPIEGWRVFGVFVACTVLWVSQALPLGATGLFAIALLPWASGSDATKIFAHFGNKSVLFLISAFLLAAAVRATGLSVRVALWMFSTFGTSARRLLTVVLVLGFGLSWLMPEHAVAAMMFPILAEVIDALDPNQKETRLYASRLYLAMVWGVVTGGVVTFLGGARTPLAIGILEETTGQTIGFVEWMQYSLPVALPMFALALLMVRLGYRWWPESIQHGRDVLARKRRVLGPVSMQERGAAIILILTLCGWIFLGERIDLAVVGLTGALLMVVTRVISFQQMQQGVDWSVIFLYAGAIALGKSMMDSGAASWLAEILVPTGTPVAVQLITIAALAVIATELISNAAVVALLLPVALGRLTAMGVDPKLVTVSVALMSGFVFNLPIGTPAMSLAFGSGHLTVGFTMRRGLILSLASILIFAAWTLGLWLK